MLYSFFWVIPRLPNFICRRFGTLRLFHIHRQVGMKNDWGSECWGIYSGKVWLENSLIYWLKFSRINNPAFSTPVILTAWLGLAGLAGAQSFFIPACLWRWNRRTVPERRHIKFGRRGITQEKAQTVSCYYLTVHYSGIFFPTFVSVHFKIICCLFSSALRKGNFALFLHILKPSSFQIPCLNLLSHSCLHIALSHSILYIILLLVAFRKIEKSDYLLCHVCPSVWNNLAPTGQILMKVNIWVFFLKTVE